MKDYFLVEHLSLERLLKEWRWLCPQTVVLVARSVFGDLYLRDEFRKILKLDVAIGQIKEVAESETEFRKLASTKEKREEWFAESDELAASRQGLKPDESALASRLPLYLPKVGPQTARMWPTFMNLSLSLANCIGRSRNCLRVRRCG